MFHHMLAVQTKNAPQSLNIIAEIWGMWHYLVTDSMAEWGEVKVIYPWIYPRMSGAVRVRLMVMWFVICD